MGEGYTTKVLDYSEPPRVLFKVKHMQGLEKLLPLGEPAECLDVTVFCTPKVEVTDYKPLGGEKVWLALFVDRIEHNNMSIEFDSGSMDWHVSVGTYLVNRARRAQKFNEQLHKARCRLDNGLRLKMYRAQSKCDQSFLVMAHFPMTSPDGHQLQSIEQLFSGVFKMEPVVLDGEVVATSRVRVLGCPSGPRFHLSFWYRAMSPDLLEEL